MTRKEALEYVKNMWMSKETHDALEALIPEFGESEDERIRKAALEGIEYLERELGWDALGDIDILDVKQYLEKQKKHQENCTKFLAKILKHSAEGFRNVLKKKGIDYIPHEAFWTNTAGTFSKQECNEFYKWMDDMTMELVTEETPEYKKGFKDGLDASKKEQKPILFDFNVPYNPDDYEVVMQGNTTSLKLKEHPKSTDSIPADCTSDAKCEDRWHKVADSMPDNPREVLCKDEAGNYFIGRYYVGEGWEISNYDDEDKPHHLNPPVSKWSDFPSEKQKEQKSALIAENDNWYICIKDFYAGGKKWASVGDLIQAKNGMYMMGRDDISEWFRRAYYEEVRDAFEPNTDVNIPEKPAEWSEEDERNPQPAFCLRYGGTCCNPMRVCINCPGPIVPSSICTSSGTSTATLHGNTSATDGKEHTPSFTD